MAKSTIIWGQWDACMIWMQTSSNGEVRNFPIAGNKLKGYFLNSPPSYCIPIPTGSNKNYSVNNIYDMAGNVGEGTMEVTTKTCIMRRTSFI